jgi:hypothetical protein
VGACCSHILVGIQSNELEVPPLHTHTTVLSYFISIVSMVLLSFTGEVTGVIQPKGMRCIEHGTYW